MKISSAEFNRIMDAIAFTLATSFKSFNAEITAEQLEMVTRKVGLDYMEWAGINDVEDEEDENHE